VSFRSHYDHEVATLEDLEARVAALEASHADYRAVLAAVNALGANQREHALGLAGVKSEVATVKSEVATVRTDVAAVKTDVAAVKTDVAALKTDVAALKMEFVDFRQETRATFRTLDEQLAEIKDLIIDRRNGNQD
jgi:septal ring factor EnvC (AmiA/AmiB activator)